MTLSVDTELFELCEEVAKKTDWLMNEDESDMYFYWEAGESTEFSIRYRNECPYYHLDEYYPLYNTDYLLEKLPPTIVARGVGFSTATRIAATSKQLIGTEADTPLKALLKLVIALDDAGELK